MAKAKTIYTCQHCGAQSPKWLGRCPECQTWDSFVEETFDDPGAVNARQTGWRITDDLSSEPVSIVDLDAESEPRLSCHIGEFDRVTGGGLVPGSVLLIGGDPGVGKSTLVLQVLGRLARAGETVLYITGEESPRQVKRRADRLETLERKLVVAAQTDLSKILRAIAKVKPSVVAVDSIQTIFTSDLSSAPGSVSQVRETVARLLGMAKREGIATLLVGHVTKDGSLAGPRVVEHMVDCVLTFEGERGYPFRVLRATKNRFGSTNEVGVFEMAREGLVEVANPSQLFLAERATDEPGSVVTVSIEGTRPLLVEVQALVSPATYGTARRTCIGLDPNRVGLLAAVLEKKGGLDLLGCDIFVNVVGGIRLSEPAVDLGVACALVSSFVDKPIPADTLVFGEVGLAGEVRSVSLPELRLAEASKMGFARAVLPQLRGPKHQIPDTITILPVRQISGVIDELF